MKKRLVAALMSGAMLLSVLGGCGQNDANTVDAQTEEKTELIFVNYRDIRDLNPHLYAGEMYAQSMLYDTLVSITDDGYEGVWLKAGRSVRTARFTPSIFGMVCTSRMVHCVMLTQF